MNNPMKTHKERVQEYVREQIPALKELSFGCICKDNMHGQLLKIDRITVKNRYICSSAYNNLPSIKDTYGAADLEIIGHTPQLHHYLAVLGEHTEKLNDYIIDTEYFTFVDDEGDSWLSFSLTDGQPSTEKDWEIMSNILGLGV